MVRVLIVYGSRHGGTQGIAERLGAVLTAEGFETEVTPADRPSRIDDVDAYVVGSGVYMGHWLKEPLEFLQHNSWMLGTRPLWLFSSGPLPGATDAALDQDAADARDPLDIAFGPAEGPGSGGHKQIAELAEGLQALDHRVFAGAYDPSDPPKAMSERVVRMLPIGKSLPSGDFRDWPAVEAWAHEIAAALRPAPVPV